MVVLHSLEEHLPERSFKIDATRLREKFYQSSIPLKLMTRNKS